MLIVALGLLTILPPTSLCKDLQTVVLDQTTVRSYNFQI